MQRKKPGEDRAGKTPSQRQLRVGEEIRHTLADLFRRGEFRDPDLRDLNVTVTEVRMSPDLRNATAFVMPLGGGHPKMIAALNRASPFLRGQVAKVMQLQFAPRLSFQNDSSFDYADKIGRLLHEADVSRDLTRPYTPPSDQEELAAEEDEGGHEEEGDPEDIDADEFDGDGSDGEARS